MKKVIITGATGFIGGALTKKLLSMGVKVYGIDINSEKLDEMKQYGDFVPIVADFTKYEKILDTIKDKDIDIFFHFALKGGLESQAIRNYELQLENVKFTCDSLVLANRLNVKKFVFAGTANEYEIRELLNSDSPQPRYTCIYSTAKLAAEMMCKTLAYNNDIEYSAGLIAFSYGEGNKSKQVVNIVINQLQNNALPKLVEGNNLYDIIYIDDIVNAFIAIGEKGKNMKSYYVGHRKLKKFKEVMKDICDIVNPNIKLQFGEYKDSPAMNYSLVDLNALYNDTGFECKADFKESILKTAEWVKTLNWND